MSKMIIIPNIDLLDGDQYEQVFEVLDCLPLNYEIWDKDESKR